MGVDRPQAVVSAFTATAFEPDETEVDIELVVYDDQIFGRHGIELGQRADLLTRGVHVGGGPGDQDRFPGEAGGGDLRTGFFVHLPPLTRRGDQDVDDHRADVVPGLLVLGPGITQADNKFHFRCELLGCFVGGRGISVKAGGRVIEAPRKGYVHF